MDEVLIHALMWDKDNRKDKEGLYKKLQETSHIDDIETSLSH